MRSRSENEDRAAVLAADREWAAAARDKDLDRSVSYMADDAMMLPPAGADFAYTHARSVYTFPGPDGTIQTIHAKGVAIWRKDADGQWRCVVDIWNDAPSPDVNRDSE